MLLYGGVERDSRVRREAATLVEDGHQVSIATMSAESRRPFELDGARIIPIRPGIRGLVPGADSPFRPDGKRPSAVGRWAAATRWAGGYGMTFGSWAVAANRRLPPADVWHGHDFLGMLAASSLRRRHGGALLYDSHELYLEAGSAAKLPGPARSFLSSIEGRASRAAEAVITVNPPIAAELHERYGVDPYVVMNCPPLRPPQANLVLRSRLQLGNRPTAIHHGVLGPGRGLEQLIDSMAVLPTNAAVVLLGDGPLAGKFSGLALQPRYLGRLFVVPAVPMVEVSSWIADADVGVIPFQAVDRNNVLATPNKLFEYLEAAVPMVVSDFPEMRRIVQETGAGVTADASDPASLGAAIRELLDEPREARQRRRDSARRAAESTYNWGVQAKVLRGVYADLSARIAGRVRA